MIQRIKKSDLFEHDHINDVKRIQEVAIKNDYYGDLKDWANLWEDYSYTSAAGWLNLPDSDEELFQIIERYL